VDNLNLSVLTGSAMGMSARVDGCVDEKMVNK